MKKAEPRFIIIGQGISGTVLSMHLSIKSIPHLVIDQPQLSKSSTIAAGLMNPIVLKRLKLVYQAWNFLKPAKPFYLDWEKRLRTKFFHPLPIFHLFSTVGEQNHWLEKSENPVYKGLLSEIDLRSVNHIESPFGYGITKETAWLDTISLITSYRHFLKEKGQYLEDTIDHDKLNRIIDNGKIILANGHLMRSLIPSTKSYFSPTRGELMVIESEELPNDKILHSGVFTLPLGQKLFKVGATYHWDKLEDITTDEALEKLKSELSKFFKGSYRIVEHLGGVRPNVKDRKPLLGKVGNNLYSFNGMGSRAALTTPYLAEIMVDHLIEDKAIPNEYDINRFTSN